MSLLLNEEQLMLRDAAKSFLESQAPVAHFRAMRDASETWSPQLWGQMVEMGWTGIVTPEDFGGLDFGCVGAGQVFEQCGRTLANSPLLVSAVVAATLINSLGSDEQKKALLPAICSGELIVSVAIAEGNRFDPKAVTATATRGGDAYVLDGTKTQILFGEAASKFLVLARVDAGNGESNDLSMFLLDASEHAVSLDTTLRVDSYTSASLTLNSARLTSDALLGEVGAVRPALEKTLDLGAACSAAELLGIATVAFERTLDYLKQRQQFGKLLGSFQALQHRAAQLYCELELTRSVVLKALQTLEEGQNAALYCSLAKAKAARTAKLAVNEAVQMHGGIGMTDEFDIGLFMKRAAAATQEFGDYYYHADRFACLRKY